MAVTNSDDRRVSKCDARHILQVGSISNLSLERLRAGRGEI